MFLFSSFKMFAKFYSIHVWNETESSHKNASFFSCVCAFLGCFLTHKKKRRSNIVAAVLIFFLLSTLGYLFWRALSTNAHMYRHVSTFFSYICLSFLSLLLILLSFRCINIKYRLEPIQIFMWNSFLPFFLVRTYVRWFVWNFMRSAKPNKHSSYDLYWRTKQEHKNKKKKWLTAIEVCITLHFHVFDYIRTKNAQYNTNYGWLFFLFIFF